MSVLADRFSKVIFTPRIAMGVRGEVRTSSVKVIRAEHVKKSVPHSGGRRSPCKL